MKYLLGIILAFALILPSKSLADYSIATVKVPEVKEDTSSIKYYPRFWGLAVGSGSKFFSTGIDFFINEIGDMSPPHGSANLFWTNRIRMIYDYENHQYGFLFQPNLRWIYKQGMFSATVGPEIGWETKTGFEYGISMRTGGLPSLFVGNYEAGYLVNSKRFYFTLSFCLSVLPFRFFHLHG